MPNLTKQDIDALVDGMPAVQTCSVNGEGCGLDNGRRMESSTIVGAGDLRRSLYLAAGLTAEGERKPERVRCWMFPHYYSDGGPMFMAAHEGCTAAIPFTPGWFVPDGAE